MALIFFFCLLMRALQGTGMTHLILLKEMNFRLVLFVMMNFPKHILIASKVDRFLVVTFHANCFKLFNLIILKLFPLNFLIV